MAGSLKKQSISNTRQLSSNLKKLSHIMKLVLQDKQLGNFCRFFGGKIIAISDDLFEFKCISRKQHSRMPEPFS